MSETGEEQEKAAGERKRCSKICKTEKGHFPEREGKGKHPRIEEKIRTVRKKAGGKEGTESYLTLKGKIRGGGEGFVGNAFSVFFVLGGCKRENASKP